MNKRQQSGATLMEVMVAVLVLSIGLAGLASLQTQGSQGSLEASYYAQATILAYDMLDRLRANPQDALNNAYELDLTDNNPSPIDLPSSEMHDWRVALEALPLGTGSITRVNPTASPAVFEIVVQWYSLFVITEDTPVEEDYLQQIVIQGAI